MTGAPTPPAPPAPPLSRLRSNAASAHAARELKSVHVRVPVLLLRLVIHRPHANSLNAGAQAGLVALNIVGEALPAQAPGGGVPSVVLSEPVSCGADGVPVVEADADAGLDPATAQLLRQLGEAKAAAVQREDFDEAKRLRDALSAAQRCGHY